MFDFSVIFLGNQLFRSVIIIISRVNNNRDDFHSRFKIHFLEFISIGVFIYSFRFKWSKSWLWLDIILFIWFFLSLIISSNSYVNILKIFKISGEANDKYNQKKAVYEKVKREVEEFNSKEKELLEVRLKYAQSDSESDKAYRDQRSYTVDRKKNPDYYTFPSRPSFEDCTGIVGLFSGKEDILNYEMRVEQFKSALEKAYKNFFANPSVGFPKFKSRHRSRKSYTTNVVNGNIRLGNGKIRLPKLKEVKIRKHWEIPDNYVLKSVTISQEPSGKYYASLLYEYEVCENQADKKPEVEVEVPGVDYAMSGMAVFSDGTRCEYPGYYRKAIVRLTRERRKL